MHVITAQKQILQARQLKPFQQGSSTHFASHKFYFMVAVHITTYNKHVP